MDQEDVTQTKIYSLDFTPEQHMTSRRWYNRITWNAALKSLLGPRNADNKEADWHFKSPEQTLLKTLKRNCPIYSL